MKLYHETQAYVFDKAGNTKKITKKLPLLKNGDALVELMACGVCSGEAMDWYVSKKQDKVLGHELVAKVIEVRGKAKVKPGDIIFPHHHAPCGKCLCCKNGYETNCITWKKSYLIPGGYAEQFVVPAHNLKNDTLILPETMQLEAGVFIEPLACCFRGLKKVGLKKKDKVLIIGLGIMGLLNGFLFSRHTSVPVIATDFIKERRKKALKLGIKKTFSPDQNIKDEVKKIWDGVMADVVVVNPSSKQAVEDGVKYLNPGGKLLLFAPSPPDALPFLNFNELYFKEVTITSSYSCGPVDTAHAMALIKKNPKPFLSLISHQMPLSQLGKAINLIKKMDPKTFKIIVKP